ncbi:MFS transporter [Simiduia agarivorans]|uniref:2-acyl-glycerophospho-ethanolamine acyltransferase n=1 Tax=Simiduia agarivorans (strain DSM 21679 / JCM 13881 / BCRC 17597 / SA1) TaxID=1117647 RepID=K4KP90_SIMAS|nr:MFS transporter [Simiduia agarivorans]AFV00842.1 2-acyl-glycerophospho-ethanolamine acyltransferase [Simiduia agarivorans SA1 = DSM 21679]
MPKLTDFRGFVPYIAVVFLNAFVDLGHKIIIQNTVFKVYDGNLQIVLTAIVNSLILLPFILLFSPSGFLSDKYPKHQIMRVSAWAVVAVTLLITLCYYQGWFWAAFAMTLLLAIQSAVYSPAKYGYIKELVGKEPLARANGVVNATSILGILMGTFVFSALFELLLPADLPKDPDALLTFLAPLGWVLVALASLELWLAHKLEDRSEPRPEKVFRLSRYAKFIYLRKNLRLLQSRPAIWLSIIGLATFWAISQVVLAAFPAFAKESLGETNTLVIQGILACTGLGIMLGSVLAGRLSRNYIETGLIPVGALGLTLALFVMPGLSSSMALALCFLILGTMGGLFIVPLNALIQFHAGPGQLGTILAGNNWIQNIAMLSFLVVTVVFAALQFSAAWLLGALGIVALLGAGYTLWKLPHAFTRLLVGFLFRGRYRIAVAGFENLPSEGPVLLLGNHISWIDWALVQIACPRPVRFVMQREIYNQPLLKPFLKIFGVIPIAKGHSEEALQDINQLLRQGEVVCLFPEGAISRNGQLGKFHTGFERAAAGLEEGVIVPFYLHGLWGSKFSRSSERLREQRAPEGTRRDLIVAFGAPLPIDTKASELKQKVFELSASVWQFHSENFGNLAETLVQQMRRHWRQLAVVGPRGDGERYGALFGRALALAGEIKRRDLSGKVLSLAVDDPAERLVAHMAAILSGASVIVTAGDNGAESTAVATLVGQKNAVNTAGTELPEVPVYDGNVSLIHRLCARFLPLNLMLFLFGRSVGNDAPVSWHQHNGRWISFSGRDLLLNSKQVSDMLNTKEDDVVGSFAPKDSAFAWLMAELMPLLEGMPLVSEAPDQTLAIAKRVARCKVTLLSLSRQQLLAMLADESVEPLMFESVRMVIVEYAGAERAELNALAESFEARFNQPVYFGLSAMPAVAVVAVNVPDALDTAYWRIQRGYCAGSAGLPLPGQSLRLVESNAGAALAVAVSPARGRQLAQEGYRVEHEQGQDWLGLDFAASLDQEGFVHC